MLFADLSAHNDVVQLDKHALPKKVFERLIYESSKVGRGVGHAKIHKTALKGPVARVKSRFRFLPRNNATLIKPGSKVNLANNSGPCWCIK